MQKCNLITVRDDNHATPLDGSIVSLVYEGRYDSAEGIVFDSSPPGRPFSFTVGDGSVIAGWDLCVRTMQQGERCGLLLQPRFAYGDKGAKGIPGGSVLYFDMQLLEWI